MTIDYCEVKRCRQQSAIQWLGHYICQGHWVLYANDKLSLRKEFGMPAAVKSDNLMASDEGLADSRGGEIEADKEDEGDGNLSSSSTASINWVNVKENILF